MGIGPTYFATTGTGRELSRPGIVAHVATRIPFEDNLGLGLRFAWGLTEFRRFEDFTRAGYRIGEWTTEAYKDVYHWAAEPDDWRLFRWMGGFFAFVVLWMPYLAAGVCYALSPIAPTTYLEADATLNYDFGTDRAGEGPYFKAGLGLLGYLHPRTDKLLGGLGPTAGLGVRTGKVDLGVHGTWLPPSLHGESTGERTNVFVGSLTIGVSNY
jgi:hypothetical protein